MKLLFTEGVGAAQTTTNAQDEKIKIFASESDMLDNIDTLDDNEIVATNDATEADLISNILTKVVPTGTILPGMWQQAPTGFLLCDGSEYLKTQYPDLARVLSGAVNAEGSTEYTFKVPDLRETVLVGTGENASLTIADHDVYNIGEFKDDQLQDHTHSISNALTPGNNQYLDGAKQYVTYLTSSGNINSGRSGTTTHGKQVGVNYIIKY